MTSWITRRRAFALLLALTLLPGPEPEYNVPFHRARELSIRSVALPPATAAALGPFRPRGAWQLISNDIRFGGYSALIPREPGRLLAISDRGAWLEFAEPAMGVAAKSRDHAMDHVLPNRKEWTSITDSEAATSDSDFGGAGSRIWISWEDRRAISRFTATRETPWADEGRTFPKPIGKWSAQFGAEAMVRLNSGRFIVVSEAFAPRSYERRHQTLLFDGDPAGTGPVRALRGALVADEGYRPTDLARLPDGRVLVLLRQLVWPLPMRFSCRIAIADPEDLRRTGRWHAQTLARLDPPLPADNYEALAVRPRRDGKLDVWVMSDDNRNSTQRSLLLKLELTPADLPPRRAPKLRQ
ncbi:MAG: esterase-like activity of phytase family protein [Pseudomonadota bacterium]